MLTIVGMFCNLLFKKVSALKGQTGDSLLWDSVLTLLRAREAEQALSVLKKAAEGTFSVIHVSPDFLDAAKMHVPTLAQVVQLKELDIKIKQSLENGRFDETSRCFVQFAERLDELFQKSRKPEIEMALYQVILRMLYVHETPNLYTHEKKAMYTTSQAAEKLNVSDQTIRRMCENDKFPGAYKTDGGHWRIPSRYF